LKFPASDLLAGTGDASDSWNSIERVVFLYFLRAYVRGADFSSKWILPGCRPLGHEWLIRAQPL